VRLPTRTAATPDGVWIGGAVAGTVAAAAMGAFLYATEPPVFVAAIPGLYGTAGPAAATAVHLSHGAVFGTVFGAFGLGVRSRRGAVVAGVGYALVLWLVGAGVVMPIWLRSTGFPTPPDLPNLDGVTLAAHVLYGVVAGALVPILER
jgi:hypothetical protein